MHKYPQIDLFGLSVFLEDKDGMQILYTIESHESSGASCFVQRRKSKRTCWGKKRLIQSSSSLLSFEYTENDQGFQLRTLSNPGEQFPQL